MADEEVVAGQAPSDTKPAPAADNQDAVKTAPQTVEELRSLLEKERKDRQDANKEAQTMRSRLRELEKAEEERKQASMSEQEKLSAELEATKKALADTQTRQREIALKAAVSLSANKFRVVDSEAAYKLLDQSKVTLDSDGYPSNVDDLIVDLVKEKPYLVQQVSLSPTNSERGSGAKVGREQELRAILYGTGQNVFDADRIVQAGGGVVKRD